MEGARLRVVCLGGEDRDIRSKRMLTPERYEAASSSVPTDTLATSECPSFLRALFLCG